MNYSDEYARYLKIFDDFAREYFNNECKNNRLLKVMEYSFFAGGKRVRPVLLLHTVDFLGGNVKNALPFAFALECIHTSSLIHDDLPAMDNDTLRRGKPTCHVAYGEADALLAGDALITLAFEVAVNGIYDKNSKSAAKLLAEFSGYNGMLYGQVLDKCAEKQGGDENDLIEIYKYKTSKLLTVPLLIGSLLCDKKFYAEFDELGNNLGHMFQAVDDVLDYTSTAANLGKSVGKDEQENKLTAVKLFGLNGAKDYIKRLHDKIENILKLHIKSEFLKCFTVELYRRGTVDEA